MRQKQMRAEVPHLFTGIWVIWKFGIQKDMRFGGMNDDPVTPLIRPTRELQSFIVIDLFSQGRAVYQHIRDWTKDEVLTWLRQWGTLESWQLRDWPETYIFCSWCGLRAPFFIQDDTLTFLSDHTTIVPPE